MVLLVLPGNCGDTFTATNGTANSPDYPMNYSNNSNCWYLISVEKANSIRIAFNDFQTEQNNDTLYFGEDQNNLIYSFDGFNMPEPFALQSSNVWLNFVTNDDIEFAGFSFNWTSYTGM